MLNKTCVLRDTILTGHTCLWSSLSVRSKLKVRVCSSFCQDFTNFQRFTWLNMCVMCDGMSWAFHDSTKRFSVYRGTELTVPQLFNIKWKSRSSSRNTDFLFWFFIDFFNNNRLIKHRFACNWLYGVRDFAVSVMQVTLERPPWNAGSVVYGQQGIGVHRLFVLLL